MFKNIRTQVKNKINKFPVSKRSLLIILIAVVILFTTPAFCFGKYALKINCCLILTVLLLPFLTAIVYFLLTPISSKTFSQIFTDTKLRRFPLLMFFDPEPAKHYRFKPKDKHWWKVIENGDLLLRRHDNYADGLILRQTGYFTHSAIAKKNDDGSVDVYHAVGAGIQKIPITKFAHCDDLVVLRITEESIKEFLDKKPRVEIGEKKEFPVMSETNRIKIKNDVTKDSIKKMIEESGKELDIDETLRDKELSIYCKLTRYSEEILNEDWQSVITGLAEGYKSKNIKYDYDFDFSKPDKMSCVEFTWNCYKCMLPVHRVKRKHLWFFNLLRAYILAPDLFVTGDAFTFVYPKFKEAKEYKAQIDIYKRSALRFWYFIFKCVACQVMLLLFIYLAQHYFSFK